MLFLRGAWKRCGRRYGRSRSSSSVIRRLSPSARASPTATATAAAAHERRCRHITNSCFNNYALCGPHSSSSTEHQANYSAKRCALEQQLDHGLGLDHRKKRLIKNRESAARSRARKQAYTNELEQEVAHLLDENSRLRRQYEELRLIMATQARQRGPCIEPHQLPFKYGNYMSSFV
uniref:BZIP domain-containing protein n=1 Tax=Ananas comosus var. bracteatus TaxID=296719 RepID=A0A6V7PIR9_ANACO|nr:unnamed protein product [Ananas comosus var. bracteatus]